MAPPSIAFACGGAVAVAVRASGSNGSGAPRSGPDTGDGNNRSTVKALSDMIASLVSTSSSSADNATEEAPPVQSKSPMKKKTKAAPTTTKPTPKGAAPSKKRTSASRGKPRASSGGPKKSLISSMAAPRGGSLLRRFDSPLGGSAAPADLPSSFPRPPSPPGSSAPALAAAPGAPPPPSPGSLQQAANAQLSALMAPRPGLTPPSLPPPSRPKAGRRRHEASEAEEEVRLTPYERILRDAAEIEAKLAYRFRDKHLLALAFVHSSSTGGRGLAHPLKPMLNNERLEFIGDAVFGLIIADHLYRTLPYADEGMITRLRAYLVCGEACAGYLRRLEVEEYLQVTSGRGSERARLSLAADLFEAVLGAIYLDSGGTDVPEWFLLHHFGEEFERVIASPPRNWKAELQEYTQRHLKSTPVYVDLGSEPVPGAVESARDWHVGVRAGAGERGDFRGRGKGATKKLAQQRAAWEALVSLGVIEAPTLPELPNVGDVMDSLSGPDATPSAPALATPAELASGFSVSAEAWGRRRRRLESAGAAGRGADVVEVARAVAGVLAAAAGAHDRAAAVPHDALAELKASACPPRGAGGEGGWGCGLAEAVAAVEALAEADAAVALAFAAHCAAIAALVHDPAAPFPPRPSTSSSPPSSSALPSSAEPAAIRGAREDGAVAHWTLSGEAPECALAPALDYVLVDLEAAPAPRDEPPENDGAGEGGAGACGCGRWCRGRPGAVRGGRGGDGLRALGPHRLLLRAVRLEPHAVAPLGPSPAAPLSSSEAAWERALTAAGSLGIATAAVRAASEHLAAGRRPSTPRPPPRGCACGGAGAERAEAGAAVLAAAETAGEHGVRVVEAAARAVGAGALRGSPLERLLRDAHACRALLDGGEALEALGRAQLDLLTPAPARPAP
eukprot:tig00000144_g9021.t1